MKRIRVLLALICILSMLTGCGQVIDLSDAESEAIAEYAAELLLKYDMGYHTKYLDGEAESTELDISTEVSTEEVTEGTTESTDTTEATTETTTSDEDTTVEDDSDTSTEESGTTEAIPTEEEYGSETDIAKIAGIDGVSVLFNSYDIVDRYPSKDKNGEFIYLDAPEGMKLIVVKFDMKNLKSEPLDVDFLNIPLEYRIVMNNEKAAKPMLTILMDDLSTYQGTLAPESTENVVLVFQIADYLVDKIEALDLKVTYENKVNIIIVE